MTTNPPPLKVVPGGDSRNKQTRLALAIIGGIFALGCVSFVIFVSLVAPRLGDNDAATRATTQTSLKYIAQAIRTYAEDHEGRLPKQDTWMADIEPLLDNPRVLEAPPAKNHDAVRYLMNPDISGVDLASLNRADPPVLVYEGDNSGAATLRGGKYTALYADFNVRSTETPLPTSK
jgi:hypothetical protein